MKTNFSTNQFIAVILVNVFFLSAIAIHYFSETVRTEVKHEVQTNTVYKDRVVWKCEAVDKLTTLMQKADNVCQDNSTNRLKNFQIDDKGNPVFHCE